MIQDADWWGSQHRCHDPILWIFAIGLVASLESGRSYRETARLFEVSVASVVKWLQRKRPTGSAAAPLMAGRNRSLRLAGERASLLERVAA